MNFKKSAIMLSFAAAMALLNTTAFAIDMSQSEVIKTTGKVSVKKVNSPEFKKLNSNLKLSGSLKNLDGGDKVRTMANSTADLVLKDTCLLCVQEQSIFEVPQVLNNKDLVALKAQQGSILFKVAKGSNFQVQTSDVICGVKGTMFSVTIVDGLNTMLETPGLQLGYAFEGGTAVKVYEGEVEVTHKSSKEKKSLKAGEGATFLTPISSLAKTTVEVMHFNPVSELHKQYNTGFDSLLKATNLDSLKGVNIVDEYSSQLNSNVYSQFNKLQINNPSIYKYSSQASEVSGHLSDLDDIARGLKGKKYQADFSRYARMDSEKSFGNTGFGEVYMGNNTLAACKAANGSSVMVAEPGLSGLVVTEGNGLVKMRIFNDKLGITGEVMANVYESGNDIVTVVRNTDGKLSWRLPGTLEIQKVPTGDVAYVFNKNTCKGYWANASAGSITNELSSFNFATEQKMQQEKKQVNEENKKNRNEALKKGANKIGGFLKKKGKFF